MKVEPPKPDIVVTSMFGILSLREFVKKDGRIQNQRLSRMSVQPRAIVVQQGVYDFPHLYAAVEALATEAIPMKDLIVKEDNTYLFRVPLLVGPGATLTINGEDGTEILLSRERGTFIANGGDLYMIKRQSHRLGRNNEQTILFQRCTLVSAPLSLAGAAANSLWQAAKWRALGIVKVNHMA